GGDSQVEAVAEAWDVADGGGQVEAAADAWDVADDPGQQEAPFAASMDMDEEETPSREPLTLRPRAYVEPEKKLDWNFGPAAWGAGDAEPEAVEASAAELSDQDEDDGLGSMRKWAERGREEVHPHFTTVHHDAGADDESPLPAPIPLRPR